MLTALHFVLTLTLAIEKSSLAPTQNVAIRNALEIEHQICGSFKVKTTVKDV